MAKAYDKVPARETLRIYGGSDYAVTADGGDFTVHAVVGLDPEGRMYLLDLWRKQAAADEWVEAFCDLVKEWKPTEWAEEQGQSGPALARSSNDASVSVSLSSIAESFRHAATRPLERSPFRGRMAIEGLYVPINASWYPALRSELLSFPAGKHDDRWMRWAWSVSSSIRFRRATSLPKPDKAKNPSGYRGYDAEGRSNDWVAY
jgi:predicted phage terminase large subunit-like protein